MHVKLFSHLHGPEADMTVGPQAVCIQSIAFFLPIPSSNCSCGLVTVDS